MSDLKSYSRQAAIVAFIRRSKKPTTGTILQYLQSEGYSATVRTVQRDLQEIPYLTDVEVIRHGSHPNLWYEVKDSPEERPLLCSYMEKMVLADVMRRELENRQNGPQVIFPDGPVMTKGLEYFATIVKSIRAGNMLALHYRGFNGKESEREVAPLFLREYRKRWYLVARDAEHAKTFGLDRIDGLSITDKTFKPKKGEDFETMFGHVIGLFENDEDPITITFSSEDYNANYLRSVPLHQSQREIGSNDHGPIFEITVVPNYEFYQTMLMMREMVEIIGPGKVREGMRGLLEKMVVKYS
jgi:proteasome accessory factor B